jgi:hypothetical protein
MSLTVKPVASRRERKLFLDFPSHLYRADPNWVPALRMDEKELLGYRHHPFYERNEIQTFLALRGREVVGRVAAILNRVHIECQNDPRGFFGFFECADDPEAAAALLDAVREWLAARDIRALRGPMSPGMNYTLGTLVEGFDSPPTFLMAYNPPYYPRLLEGCGLRKVQDFFAYAGFRNMLPASDAKHGPIADQIVERYNVRVRMMDRSRFREDVEAFIDLYNRSMEWHWGFSPMSAAEARHLAKNLRWLLVPELTAAAEIDGKLVGAAFAILDYNPRIRKIKGRLFPFGFIRLLRNRRAIHRVRLVAANVVPEYQLMGLGLVLLRALVPQALGFGLEEVEYSWIAESNGLSRGSLEKGGAMRTKTYRVYDWP